MHTVMAFLDGFLLCWYLLTLLSLIFLVYDQVTNTPSMWVMGLAWFLVLLYTGPLGLFFYFTSCRNPLPGMHSRFIDSHWKQALGSEIHCVAGDATAIIVAAAILHYAELANGIDLIVEYAAAYLFGLFIFQALFMLTMYSGYWVAVRKTIFAETVSMNLVMTGMLPVILIFKSLFPLTSDPLKPYFWGLMSLATIVGFIFGYPINSWMVGRGLKHGMMSRPSAQTAHSGHAMKSSSLPWTQALFHIVWTYALLIGGIWLVGLFIQLSFS